MKLNWGHYIIIAFALFIGLILFMVIRSYQHNNDLVSEDYYQKEIEFQEIIDKRDNAMLLDDKVTWETLSNGILVSFPELSKTITGKILLFRPSDKEMDVTFTISLDGLNQQKLLSQKLIKGKYLIKIEWTDGVEQYYTEGTVFVQE